jgi:hypothetical protein
MKRNIYMLMICSAFIGIKVNAMMKAFSREMLQKFMDPEDHEIVKVSSALPLPSVITALYYGAEVSGNGCLATNSGKGFESNTEAMQVFHTYYDGKQLDYVRGKKLHVYISQNRQGLPFGSDEDGRMYLDVKRYNERYGAGKAQELLQDEKCFRDYASGRLPAEYFTLAHPYNWFAKRYCKDLSPEKKEEFARGISLAKELVKGKKQLIEWVKACNEANPFVDYRMSNPYIIGSHNRSSTSTAAELAEYATEHEKDHPAAKDIVYLTLSPNTVTHPVTVAVAAYYLQELGKKVAAQEKGEPYTIVKR